MPSEESLSVFRKSIDVRFLRASVAACSSSSSSSEDQLDAGRRPLSQYNKGYTVPLCPIHCVDPFLN